MCLVLLHPFPLLSLLLSPFLSPTSWGWREQLRVQKSKWGVGTTINGKSATHKTKWKTRMVVWLIVPKYKGKAKKNRQRRMDTQYISRRSRHSKTHDIRMTTTLLHECQYTWKMQCIHRFKAWSQFRSKQATTKTIPTSQTTVNNDPIQQTVCPQCCRLQLQLETPGTRTVRNWFGADCGIHYGGGEQRRKKWAVCTCSL